MRKITILLVALLMSSALIAQTYYSEDFTNDPNFTSLSPTHAYWDNSQGNYYVKTYDNEQYQYWAYSPQFSTVNSSSDFTIKLDMLCENADWGTYPGVHFYNNAPTTLDESSRTLAIRFVWSDNNYKKISIGDASGNGYKSSSSFSNNTWYSVTINYYASSNKADIIVKETSSGSTFYQETNVDLILSDISYLGVGYYDNPNYGDDWSPIRIDNIEISGNCATSVNSEIKRNENRLYPNPVKDKLLIDIKDKTNGEIQIFNSLGQSIHTMSISNNNEIDMSSYQHGIYFVVIKNNKGNILLTEKIVKE